MKKNSLILMLIMIFTISFSTVGKTTYAADYNSPARVKVVMSNSYKNGTTIGTSWKTIATSTSGFNCNVYIKCSNISFLPGTWTVSPTDIRMLDKNGNEVWIERGAISGLGDRTFWCGSNVYTIQAKCQTGSGSIYVHRAN